MGRSTTCVVPTCKFRNKANVSDRRSMFRCPSNLSLAREWSKNIGILLKRSQCVCEVHFEPQYLRKFLDKSTGARRCRLTGAAVPTIFYNYNASNYEIQNSYLNYNVYSSQNPQLNYEINNSDCSHSNCNEQFSQDSYQNYNTQVSQNLNSKYIIQIPDFETQKNLLISLPNTNSDKFEVSQIELKDDTSKLPRIENSMTDVVQDLVASQDVLMNIKKEEFAPEESIVKVEPTEDFAEKFNKERKSEMQRFTVYQYVKYNKKHLTSLLPESWHIFILSTVSNEEIISFSKECTVNENIGLLIMYEKNIVIYKNGNVHYSIHGKRLKDIDPFNLPKYPENIPNTEIMLKVIKQFDEVKVCQGLLISEFEFHNDYTIYKDDLGIKRHLKCYLMSDTQQCDNCFGYKQSLMSNMMNRSQVLSDKRLPSFFKNNQIYYKSSR